MTNIKFFPEKNVDGIVGWNWIESDTGAWDGPKRDWETSHKPNIEKYCLNFRTAIQAGGNQGMYPKLLSTMFHTVYTFEPDPLNFRTLVSNCTDDNIIKMQAALGSNNDFCVVNRCTMQNTGMHTVSTNQDGIVPVMQIDQFDFKNVDLIMLDLEGYEFNALVGAAKTIRLHKPVIFAERPTQEIVDLLAKWNYIQIAQSEMDGVFAYMGR